jgi:hypothetical protein
MSNTTSGFSSLIGNFMDILYHLDDANLAEKCKKEQMGILAYYPLIIWHI